jgi:uncharacterized protein with NAD-binding domain and iron-sulfur cluster
MAKDKRVKVAVLGGGTGSLAAVFGLTSDPQWRDRYDITVYQQGWRLGGKGASGRNQKICNRIEEHGLHIWAGFYDNAFAMMRTCYEEMGRPTGTPLAGVFDAFKPKSTVTLMENVGDQWKNWTVTFPANAAVPGDHSEMPTEWEYLKHLFEWMFEQLLQSKQTVHKHDNANKEAATSIPNELWDIALEAEEKLVSSGKAALAAVSDFDRSQSNFVDSIEWLIRAARAIIHSLESNVENHLASLHHWITWAIDEFRKQLLEIVKDHLDIDDTLRRLWLIVDLSCATIIGMIADGVILEGFSVIDDDEWRVWLKKHGATDAVINSVLTRGVYDYVFGYENGDVAKANIGAGTCTHGLMRLAFTYKGALFWEMQAGMGDTVFTPLYVVLKNRGVKFKFFHRVDNLQTLDSDPSQIDSIDMGIQVNLKHGEEYDPLVDVKDLACWPSAPLYDQIQHGNELRNQGVNLESPWTDWKDVDNVTLKRGTDFDEIILGISVAALPSITPSLMATSATWKKMVEATKTVSTQAMQLWLDQDADTFGWPHGRGLLTGFADDLNTWGDLSYLLEREEWSAEHGPENESYFCGPLKDPDAIPPYSDHEYPTRRKEEVRKSSIEWIKQNLGAILPKLVEDGVVDWGQFFDEQNASGELRFNSQYWRANLAPTERYVLSLAGTMKHRLRADQSGFENLHLAGDWVATPINAGCIEAATMAGLAASRSLSGQPKVITGYYD